MKACSPPCGLAGAPCPLTLKRELKAALSALKQFSEQGLESIDGTVDVEKGSLEKQAKHRREKADNNQANPGSITQDCKKSKSAI
ncbi:putative double-stranded RNA-binding protein Staufen isoform 2 [Cricetulus griseus]|nr:putative double-stranded RNA-binding protein Staufen isoform 2 [Cricetulus griseus]